VTGQPRVTLLTRPGCHLCQTAREELDRLGVGWSERDVTTDAALEREYGDRLPVVLLDGREHGYWRVEGERLLRDLAR
jgi:glutaredoxin